MPRTPTGYQGVAFGIMDGVITALGILMGLSIFESGIVIFIAIMAAGIADAFANAAGMHVSEEIERVHTGREVWKSTFYAFLSTLLVFLLLAMPILFLDFRLAIYLSWGIGIGLLAILGNFASTKKNRLQIILEYVAGGVVISLVSYGLATFIKPILG